MTAPPDITAATAGPLSIDWRVVAYAAVRVVATIVALLLAYFLLPLDRLGDVTPVLLVLLALVLLVGLTSLEVAAILRSPRPVVQALEAVGVVIPLLLMVFATSYYLQSLDSPAAFTEHLDRLDSLYFTVTVFATVGFGDITPVSTTARSVVTLQMVADLIALGAGIKAIVSAVRVRRRFEQLA